MPFTHPDRVPPPPAGYVVGSKTNLIEWFTDLRDVLKAGNVEKAVEAVEAAIKLLEKKL